MYIIKKICCICLQKQKSLVQFSACSTENVSYFTKLTSSVPEIGFPELLTHGLICRKCRKQLDEVYRFREQCLRNKPHLTDYISKLYTTSDTSSKSSVELVEVTHTKVCKSENCEDSLDQKRIFIESLNMCEVVPNPYNEDHNFPLTIREDRNEKEGANIKEEVDDMEPVYDSTEQQQSLETNKKENSTFLLNDYVMVTVNEDRMTEDTGYETPEQVDVKNDQEDTSEDDEQKNTPAEETDPLSFDPNETSTSLKRNKTKIKKNKHICDICNKSLSTSGNLQAHKMIHTGAKPFTCDQCEKAFLKSSDLVRHYRIHTGERPFACTFCDKAFSTSGNLLAHKRTHTGDKKYKCDTCGKAFQRSFDLFRHNQIHTDQKPFKCEFCYKTFSRMCYLNTHKRTHTGERPFVCDICENSFTAASNLLTHRRRHFGMKPFVCDQCDKSFVKNSDLVKHYRTHTGQKPFSCDYCEKTFSNSSNLLVHKRKH